MYATTFYSYKGGVGRTMALANVAYLLAARDKRVLVVDFDLEAPGLTSYGPFRCAAERPGIVEYVLEFLETNVAPVADEYLVECFLDGTSIWMMPAGRHTDASYPAKFSSINWRALYEERDGFLLFEDLKQQWAQFQGAGFDYVLIDSRTGHTDIGGICTRQLPDAVVIMFVPTPQNIEGLTPIVKAIRDEGDPVRREPVKLLFCPANVPDLDDQELILKALLETAQTSLGYKEPAAVIQHYGALDLLQQPIYAAASPKSRLARQYENLRTAIVAGNLADRDGALTTLTDVVRRYEAARKAANQKTLDLIETQVARVKATFPQDPQIAWHLAEFANHLTRPDDELAALDVVINSSDEEPLAYLRRASARLTLDDREGALADLRTLLTTQAATPFETRPAIHLIKLLDPQGWRGGLQEALHNPRMDAYSKNAVLTELIDERESAPKVVALAEEAMREGGSDEPVLETSYILALIADGRFKQAMDQIAADRQAALALEFLPDVFNYALAAWGADKEVPLDLMQRVITLRATGSIVSDANSLQCFALCLGVLGRRDEALRDIDLAKLKAQSATSVFSCWRYLTVSSDVMIQDLDEMGAFFASGRLLNPPTRDGLHGANTL